VLGFHPALLRGLTGHASLREIERYTRAADQARMARSAMAKTGHKNKPGWKVSNPTRAKCQSN
jgi:hypothetical protein